MRKENLRCVVYFTDSHVRLSATKRRTDDLFAAQLKKLKWIANRAKELNADSVLCGGDFGDSWDWKISMVNKVSEVLKEFSMPIYTVVGNHDVPGRNPELWRDTGIGLLDSVGLMKVLPQAQTVVHSWYTLTGFNSDAPETDSLVSGKYVHSKVDDRLNIAIAHAGVGAETTPFCKGHKELFISSFDVALFGDIHPGWPVYESLTGCKICNPGALSRLSKGDIYRKPQIAVIYEDGTIVQEEVPCTAPKDCFDLETLEVEKQELGKGFLAAIAAKQITEKHSPQEYVQKIGDAAKYSKEAISILVKELDNAKPTR
jgi:exonuclease SbcD